MPGHLGIARRTTLAAILGTGVGSLTGITTPQWTGTPSIHPVEGVAGSASLPVTGATSVIWKGPGSKPAWLTLSATQVQWTAAATQQTLSGVVLTATNASGSVDCSPFALTVSAAPSVTGFFAGFAASTRQFAYSYPGDNDNGITLSNKQTRFAPHPNGRMFMFGGDQVDSGTQQQWSVDPSRWVDGNRPSAWKLVMPNNPAAGFQTHPGRDCSSVCWDSKRRVFWSLGGYDSRYAAEWQDTGKYFTPLKVLKFDPAKPLGQGYTGTNVNHTAMWKEGYGRGLYDPLLDLCVSSMLDGGYPKLQWFDPAIEQWLGYTVLDTAPFALGSSYSNATSIHIDSIQRKLWLVISDRAFLDHGFSLFKIIEVALPTTRAEFPSGGATISWAARAVVRYSNPSNRLMAQGAYEVLENEGTRKLFRWLVGPAGTNTDGSDGGSGSTLGICGRPEWGNETPPTNTAILIDIDTGAEELVQTPHPKYGDGLGWVIPNVTLWDQKQRVLMYGTCAFEAALTTGIEPKMHILRAKPVSSWTASLPLFSWYEIPNSTCSTMTGEARTVWTGPEASGGSACRLNPYQNPWNFSTGCLRQVDATLLFHGGGGGDGEANGVLGFVCNAEVPYWTLPMAPTPRSYTLDGAKKSQPPFSGMDPYVVGDIFSKEFNHTYADPYVLSIYNGQKTPTAGHAYGSAVFLEAQDMWLRFGTQMVHPTDWGLGDQGCGVHGFHWSETKKPYTSRLWTLAHTAIPFRSGPPERAKAIAHPWTGDVLYFCGGYAHYWRAAANAWQRVDDGNLLDWSFGPAFIDPQNHVALCPTMPAYSGGPYAPRMIDLETGTTVVGHAATSWVGPAVDSGEWLTTSRLNYAWDDDNQCAWCVKADYTNDQSFDLYKIRLESRAGWVWRVEKITTTVAVGSTRPVFPTSSGSFGNTVHWSRELGGLLVNVGYDKPIYFIKTSIKV